MRRFLITAAIGLAAAGLLTAGCSASAQQSPAVIGSATRSPVTRPSTATGAATAAAAVTVTGNVGLSSSQLNAAITAAIAQATALHVSGTMMLSGGVLTLDAHLNKNGPSTGTLGFEGASVPFVSTGSVDYFQLTTSFMALVKLTDPAARGRWVTSTSSYGESLVTLFSTFLTLKSFVGHGMACRGGTFAYAGPGQLGSQHIAVYREQADGGVRFDCDFPTVGAALMLRDSGGDGDGDSQDLDFTWNQPTTAEVPPASEMYAGSH